MRNVLPLLFILNFFACTDDTLEPIDTGSSDAMVWTGTSISFEKAAGTDPNDAANQDRITDNVWLTRANDGGQIYNVKVEEDADKNTSPAGTLWALGDIAERESLNFTDFRSAVGRPQNAVDKDLVLLLVEENIFLSVRFTSWSKSKAGGFAYERSTEN